MIVATGATQAASDVRQLVPMFVRVRANTGRWPVVSTADSGYFSEAKVTADALAAVELVFGQIKEQRAVRRSSVRGLAKVGAEWDLICATHNLLKLFRSCAA